MRSRLFLVAVAALVVGLILMSLADAGIWTTARGLAGLPILY